ncbi:MAG: hypothetical protein HQK67_12995 [Desulfamplus sp.]|nr:hypothetical protein [Desulfamplus sp.]
MKWKNLVLQFQISLQEVKPFIWRRIQVPATYSFWDFHVAIDFQKNILAFSILRGNHKGLPLQCSCQFNYLENYIQDSMGWLTAICICFVLKNPVQKRLQR